MMEDNNYPVLYVFVRTDMPSMTPGKAQAHSGHAANAFMYKAVVAPMQKGLTASTLVLEWMNAASAINGFESEGFGTQINLKGDWPDVCSALDKASDRECITDIVTDPTYPYIVNSEILELIHPDQHTMQPKDIGNGNWLCFRGAQTAAYIFGRKSQLSDIVGSFELHP